MLLKIFYSCFQYRSQNILKRTTQNFAGSDVKQSDSGGLRKTNRNSIIQAGSKILILHIMFIKKFKMPLYLTECSQIVPLQCLGPNKSKKTKTQTRWKKNIQGRIISEELPDIILHLSATHTHRQSTRCTKMAIFSISCIFIFRDSNISL